MATSGVSDVAAVMLALEEIAGGHLASQGMRAVMKDAAKRTAEHAQADPLTPVGTVEHTTKGGHVSKPGDYRDGIKGTAEWQHGRWVGKVRATDFTSYWIEYGSKHNPTPKPIIRRAAEWVEAGGLDAEMAVMDVAAAA